MEAPALEAPLIADDVENINEHCPSPEVSDAGAAKRREGYSWYAIAVQISNSMIGSGILAFPNALAQTGSVLFSFNIFVFFVAVYATSAMLVMAGERRGILNFSRLTEDVFGPRTAKVIGVSIALVNFGALLNYLTILGSIGSKLISQWSDGINDVVDTNAGFIAVVAVCLLPLAMFRTYGELAPFSAFALAMVAAVTLFVSINGNLEAGSPGFYIAQPWQKTGFSGLKTLGTLSYAASDQQVILEAYLSTVKEDKPKFISHTLVLANIIGFSLLCVMSVFGYSAFGQACDADILSNFDVSEPAVQAAYLLVVLHLMFYIPNDFVIMRLFALESFGYEVLDMSSRTFICVTVVLFAIPCVLMASVPPSDVSGVFSYTIDLTGDLPTGFACFAMPAAIYLKVFTEKADRTVLWYLAIPTVLLGLILMIICPVVDTVLFAGACLSSGKGCSEY